MPTSVKVMEQKTLTNVIQELKVIGGQKIGQNYLPFKEVPTMKTAWNILKTQNRMAEARSLDGEASLRGRLSLDEMNADMVDVAEKEVFNTSDVMRANNAGVVAATLGDDQAIAKAILDGVRRNFKQELKAALRRIKASIENKIEFFRINALVGIVTVSDRGVVFSVDYGVPANQKNVAPGTVWSTIATADPITDIENWQAIVKAATGVTPTDLIVSSKVMKYLAQNAKILAAMKTNASVAIFGINEVKATLEQKCNITITVYDGGYTDETGANFTRFLAENKVLLLPSKADFPEGLGDVATTGHVHNDFKQGFYTWQEEKKDPAEVTVGAGLVAFPRIMRPELLFNANVY